MTKARNRETAVIRAQPGAVALLMLLLGACSSSDEPPPPFGLEMGLNLACQTVECECRDNKETLFSKGNTADIVWKPTGDASCPAGFELKKIEKNVLGGRK